MESLVEQTIVSSTAADVGGNMNDDVVVLTREERDKVMKAVAAIHHQLKVMIGEPQPHAPSLWMIGMQLTIIQSTVARVPLTNSN